MFRYFLFFLSLFREESEDYGGPYPFSEPETAAVKFLVEQYRRRPQASPSLSPTPRTLRSSSQLPSRETEEEEEVLNTRPMERTNESSQRDPDLEGKNLENQGKDRRRLGEEEEEEVQSGVKKMKDEEEGAQTSSLLTSLGRFEAALNFHTYGELWTRPFNCCKNWPLPLWAEKAFVELQQ